MELTLVPALSVADNIFLGREVLTRWGTLDDATMEAETRKVMARLNPHFRRFKEPVKALSGGERNRLMLAKLFARPANVLVLDEPTNDLDIESLELLEAALQDYDGTILLVSHALGSVRSGTSGQLAPVTADGRLRGFQNIWIAEMKK